MVTYFEFFNCTSISKRLIISLKGGTNIVRSMQIHLRMFEFVHLNYITYVFKLGELVL